MTISSKQDRTINVEDYLYLLPEGPNATKSDINYTSTGKSDYNELGFLKRGIDGNFTSEHKEFYHLVREKTKEAYNRYPNSEDFETLTPSDLGTEFIEHIKEIVVGELPTVFYVDSGKRYQNHFPIHEMIKSYHRNKHARYLKRSLH